MKETEVLTTKNSWGSFHNDDVLQIKGSGLGCVCEFSFRLDEPHAKVFKGGGWWASGISQQTPKMTTTMSD
jgi:hypothetical protein